MTVKEAIRRLQDKDPEAELHVYIARADTLYKTDDFGIGEVCINEDQDMVTAIRIEDDNFNIL